MIDQIAFSDIPEEYQTKMNEIEDSTMKMIYESFRFHYLRVDLTHNQKHLKKLIMDHLKEFKFIIYKCSRQFEMTNVVICSENECIVIEQINIKFITDIFKEIDISIINITSPFNNSIQNNQDINAIIEVNAFCKAFQKVIMKNSFIEYTIKPMIGYLIRRYFYPSNYFKDPSFFIFYQIKNSILFSMFKKCITNLIKSTDCKFIREEMKRLKNKLEDEFKSNDNLLTHYDFNINDLVLLRQIPNDKNELYIVIHTKSLHVFLFKKANIIVEREEQFCEKYFHRCFVPFYGFVSDGNNKRIGFIYEFMSNGNLFNYIDNNTQKNKNNFFSFTIINRVFQGLNFLHSNNLVHRDIKCSNIFFDHDWIQYIGDFETIRQIGDTEKNPYTFDFCSFLYSPPEQYYGWEISSLTDIYSYGNLIYNAYDLKFLFKDEDEVIKMFSQMNKNIPKMENGSQNVQYIYKSCLQFDQAKRCTHQQINEKLIDEINSLFNNENMFNEYYKDIEDENELIYYFYENICLMLQNKLQIESYLIMIYAFLSFRLPFINEILKNFESIQHRSKKGCSSPICYHQSNNVFSNLMNWIGCIYSNGICFDADYSKAKYFFEISANLNNSDALNNLGNFYLEGKSIEKNYDKAREYYISSADLNNSYALNNIGFLYLNGFGVEQNFQKSNEYFELSANLNNSYALYNMGIIHERGFYVKQDYSKAKSYYELSAQMNNSNGQNSLGKLHKYGLGVNKDFNIAKYYFELAAQKNNSNALYNLGFHYLECAKIKDFQKAKYYYELSAQYKNSCAYNALGHIYKNGIYLHRDLSKAKYYYELGAEDGNPDSINHLAELYFKGFGVIKDVLMAKHLYEESAKMNNTDAIHRLGMFYYLGVDNYIQKDYEKARTYFEKAGKQKNSYSLLYLGNIYFKGLGVKRNYEMAINFFKESKKLNNPIAKTKLGHIYNYGYGVQQDHYKAQKYYEKSAHKNVKAYYELACLFNDGIYFDINYDIALKYFHMCIENGQENFIFEDADYYYNGYNYKYYPSSNCIGLIYITSDEFLNIKKSEKYLQIAAFSEYPFGQYCYGLYSDHHIQFFLEESKFICIKI